ncbi:MAG: ribosomal RNA small subunit methyltransferase A [Nitrospirae bacterium]|nr:ribosomal RNA small subunit methyltransferase A [Nitrospirota bacterium]
MRRKFGQHFLFDPSILRKIVEGAEVSKRDLVVEIGPGKGRLTELLAEKAREVIAIEIDDRLCDELRVNLLPRYHNIRLHCQDVLKYPFGELPDFKVVANIPYYITTPIIFKLIEDGKNMHSATLTIQKEVAERIVASPGRKDYGVLSLMVQYFTEPEILFNIPRGAFVPPPRVDSAVIRLIKRTVPAVDVKNERLFFKIIKRAFSQRRKTILNSLKIFNKDMKSIFDDLSIDPKVRPETLSIEDFARISDKIYELSKKA